MDLMKKKKQELIDIILRKDDIDKKRIVQIHSCMDRIEELKEEITNYKEKIGNYKEDIDNILKNSEEYQKYVSILQDRIDTIKRYNRTYFSLLLCSIIAIIAIIVF